MIEFGNINHGLAIACAAGTLIDLGNDVIISHTRNDKLLGGVVYYDFTGKTVAIHVAGFDPGWLSRDLLWVTFHYAFVQLKCASIFAEIRSRNIKTIAFVKRIGFSEEVIIPEVFPEDDLVIYRLREAECKWHRIKPLNITPGGKEYTNGWKE